MNGILGQTMIESVKIQNFRCFSELEVHGLKPINIIVGENASGKSAFLESVFISSGSSVQVPFTFRVWRQFGGTIAIQPDSSSYQELWEDLFYSFDQTRTISIEAIGTSGDSRSLRIWYGDESNQVLPFGQQPVPSGFMPQINFKWQGGDREPITVRPKFAANGLQIDGATPDHFPSIMFGPHISQTAEENAKRFSALSKNGKTGPILKALRSEFPFIRALSVEYISSTPAVFAGIEGQSRKFPIGLVSDGINKLFSILLAIASYPNGTVLVDEIENGFYFKKLPSIWKLIHGLAKENQTQIFATTHSGECLDALLPVLQENEEDFALLRASRTEDSTKFSVINGRRFGSALSQEFELR
jgi:hypothetical protein